MAIIKKEVHQPPPTELVVPKTKFKADIQQRIDLGIVLKNRNIQTQNDFDENKKDYYLWNDYNSEYLKQSFNNEHNEYKSSYDTCADYVGFIGLGARETPQELLQNHKTTIEKKVENLEKLFSKSDLLKSNIFSDNPVKANDAELSENIFIVHGHDERVKLEVANTINKLGLKPIILSEQPNHGQTIIEKFESYSNVGFSIVLLTADDLGRVKSVSEDCYRTRQNVILEMGYFLGKLGRAKVFPLYEPGVELPSDLHGILYVPLDVGGAWKMRLASELKAAGYNVDANNLL